MAGKKKGKRPKRRSYFRRIKGYRRKDKRMPLSVGVGLATSVLAPPVAGWTSALDAVKTGQYDKAIQSFVASWTGIQIGGIGGVQQTTVDVGKLLNPLDGSYAPALKTTLIIGMSSKVIKKFVGDPLSKIPFLNKYVKFA